MISNPSSLFKLGDKYGTDTALQIFTLLLRPEIATRPAITFAIGAIYGSHDILVESLQHFGDKMKPASVSQVYTRLSSDLYVSETSQVRKEANEKLLRK